jgi:FKBP-type peptidyl-prolyl cis-trans isomerase
MNAKRIPFLRPALSLAAGAALLLGACTQPERNAGAPDEAAPAPAEEAAPEARPDAEAVDAARAAAEAGPRPGALPAPEDVAEPPENAGRTQTGLASRVITPGEGEVKPTARDVVTVHYTGWTTDGEMFDSSRVRGQPATFPLDRVIPGWSEGVGLMVVGETRRLWIPEQLAYGGRPGAPQGMLVFDVELLDIQQPWKAPDDVAAPPADADRTDSGLASRVLRAGEGDRKPGPTSIVTVHYTGWTTDGQMFDSSYNRGQPTSFPLNQVIAGWTEGLQLMQVGERRRLWIPEDLAYGGQPGRPQGMLVFDVELLEVR